MHAAGWLANSLQGGGPSLRVSWRLKSQIANGRSKMRCECKKINIKHFLKAKSQNVNSVIPFQPGDIIPQQYGYLWKTYKKFDSIMGGASKFRSLGKPERGAEVQSYLKYVFPDFLIRLTWESRFFALRHNPHTPEEDLRP